MEISIGELSRRTGVKVPTIRYYESVALMAAPPRRKASSAAMASTRCPGSFSFVTPASLALRSRPFGNCWR